MRTPASTSSSMPFAARATSSLVCVSSRRIAHVSASSASRVRISSSSKSGSRSSAESAASVTSCSLRSVSYARSGWMSRDSSTSAAYVHSCETSRRLTRTGLVREPLRPQDPRPRVEGGEQRAQLLALVPQPLRALELRRDGCERALRVVGQSAQPPLGRRDEASERARPRLALLCERAQLPLRHRRAARHLAQPPLERSLEPLDSLLCHETPSSRYRQDSTSARPSCRGDSP